MRPDSQRAVVAALLANVGIAAAKMVGFAFTGAASMLAEAVHSVADTTNQGLLFLGGRLSRREASAEHPFGYGRERYFWSFIVALVIFALGSMFALVEGVSKLRHPRAIESPAWAIGILGLAAALESWSFATARHEAQHIRGRSTWWEFVRRAKIPELPVVLLEDLGALVGLFFALCGVTLALVTGDPRWDALGSVAIGLLLGAIAAVLAVEMRSLLLGEAASPDAVAAIRRALETSPPLRRVIHLRTEHLGPDELLVGVKVELDQTLTVQGIAEAIDAIEARVRAACPIARVIYVEPDVFHPPGKP